MALALDLKMQEPSEEVLRYIITHLILCQKGQMKQDLYWLSISCHHYKFADSSIECLGRCTKGLSLGSSLLRWWLVGTDQQLVQDTYLHWLLFSAACMPAPAGWYPGWSLWAAKYFNLPLNVLQHLWYGAGRFIGRTNPQKRVYNHLCVREWICFRVHSLARCHGSLADHDHECDCDV